MNIKISVARAADALPIARMSRMLVEHGLPWSWTEDRVHGAIRHRETAVIVARDRRRLAGFAIMQFLDAHAHLSLLAVAPAYRGQGLGRELVEWLEACARTAGLFDVRLELRAQNDTARAFYESLGYCEAGSVRAYYAGREDATRMRRDLSVSQAEFPGFPRSPLH
ncbi:MAG: GNAT family N-acetyltransferase [Gammaproteobacteria bacterium]|jgi:ribosomal-protein-alanine N-acetyltransferase